MQSYDSKKIKVPTKIPACRPFISIRNSPANTVSFSTCSVPQSRNLIFVKQGLSRPDFRVSFYQIAKIHQIFSFVPRRRCDLVVFRPQFGLGCRFAKLSKSKSLLPCGFGADHLRRLSASGDKMAGAPRTDHVFELARVVRYDHSWVRSDISDR